MRRADKLSVGKQMCHHFRFWQIADDVSVASEVRFNIEPIRGTHLGWRQESAQRGQWL